MRQAIALAALSLAWQGCAATFTTAWGEDAAARLFAPPGASCEADGPQVVGTRTEKREERTGKLGPDDVVTVETAEPALAPPPAPVPLAESGGSKVSETGGGVIRTALGFLGGVAKGLLGLFVTLP